MAVSESPNYGEETDQDVAFHEPPSESANDEDPDEKREKDVDEELYCRFEMRRIRFWVV